jgi:protein-L-isoaspartate(D-aspartate) O-methyltransferase
VADIADLHRALVDGLVARGVITDARVQAAFRAVPRHAFLPGVAPEDAYQDRVVVTKWLDGEAVSSSSQPEIMALMLQQLAVAPGHRVLEIGAGTGYNAALLAQLTGAQGTVVTVDIDDDIVEGARANLAAADLARVRVVRADGGLGLAEGAPWDRIILTVGAWDVAPAWREQLAPGGRLVLPLALGGGQRCVAFTPEDDHLASVSLCDCIFMPLRGAFAAPPDRVPLGTDPTVMLLVRRPDTIDAAAFRALLEGPATDAATSVEVTLKELYGGAIQWLALHQPGFAWLVASGAGFETAPVPELFQRPGEFSTTAGLVDGAAACFLRRPALASDGAPFPLGVRGFGRSEALVERAIQTIARWDAHGRPTTAGMRVRAYPVDAAPPASGDAIRIEKRWHAYDLDWPARSPIPVQSHTSR